MQKQVLSILQLPHCRKIGKNSFLRLLLLLLLDCGFLRVSRKFESVQSHSVHII